MTDKEYNAMYHRNNYERRNEQSKKYYYANRERILAYHKAKKLKLKKI